MLQLSAECVGLGDSSKQKENVGPFVVVILSLLLPREPRGQQHCWEQRCELRQPLRAEGFSRVPPGAVGMEPRFVGTGWEGRSRAGFYSGFGLGFQAHGSVKERSLPVVTQAPS